MHNLTDLETALEESVTGALWLFKQSRFCGVSHAAYREFLAFVAGHRDGRYWTVTVQDSRALSHAIAERLDVVHETPQAILLFERQVQWVGTHRQITRTALAQAGSALST